MLTLSLLPVLLGAIVRVDGERDTMHPYPHLYIAAARGTPTGATEVTSLGLPALQAAAPVEFEGPGGMWSPEALLIAAVADCFVLTFRAVARANGFKWTDLDCRVEGVLERIEGGARFTRFAILARLTIDPDADAFKARDILQRAERGCLVANSLRGQRTLESEVIVCAGDARAEVN